MKRKHAMPFGAEFSGEGQARFRLWAPTARRVTLLVDAQTALPMQTAEGGWYELECAQTRAGSRYCFQIDDGPCVPDPASRCNPDDVHGASQVVDPAAFDWQDGNWRGRPWEEAVIYEVHVGAFTPQGTFAALESKLDYLAALGVTAIELMPVADFPGRRDWGYDGTLLFAPDSVYGTPEDLKSLVQAAHCRGLMVLLDVVYNHFGPEGNYLHLYAPQFFTERHQTPWGAAINFDGAGSRTVRDFFIHNALYWLEEYHFDGLRLDAVHAIFDDSRPDILEELAHKVRAELDAGRHIHLVLENDRNAAHYLVRHHNGHPEQYDAQWNDDAHHACHVLLTGERDGYYGDYAEQPIRHLGRCLTEGFAYQGEISPYRHGEPRGEPSAGLPSPAFVIFLQNHDQIGNRAMGERLPLLAEPEALRAATILFLLAPSPPLLFMGEEWGARQPFPFFCDFGADLAAAVTVGRRHEFARFERFRNATAREAIPDPSAARTFELARLDWNAADLSPHREWLSLYRELLALRQLSLVPLLHGARGDGYLVLAPRALRARWKLGDGSRLEVHANLGTTPVDLPEPPDGVPLYCAAAHDRQLASGELPGFAVAWHLGGDNA